MKFEEATVALMGEKYHENESNVKRIDDIDKAMRRCKETDVEVPKEWQDEYIRRHEEHSKFMNELK